MSSSNHAFIIEIMASLISICTNCFPYVKQITARGEKIGLHHFKPIKPLGSGDTGRYMQAIELD